MLATYSEDKIINFFFYNRCLLTIVSSGNCFSVALGAYYFLHVCVAS